MGKYITKRVLLLIPTLLIVCIIVFTLMRMIPGSAVDMIVYRLGQAGQQVSVADVEAKLGMDKPAAWQFFTWFTGILRGDFGTSLFQNESVLTMIGRQLQATLELALLTLILTNIISIPLGLYCAARQDSISDYTIRSISIILMALPVFWIATLVLIYPALWWQYAPPAKYVSFFSDPIQNLKMFFIPSLLGALSQTGHQLRTVRTVTLETMRQDYIRTAWSKGVSEGHIMFRHAFRNAMIPVITVIGSSIPGLIGGSVILENMFNIPGIGAQLVTSLDNRDYPVVQGCVLIFAIIVMIINLVVDISYKWIDPRVELE